MQLDNVIEAAFYAANRLFGLSFARIDAPVWHPDVRAWEVKGADGKHVGLFFGDYLARPSKQGGAWMSTLRDQEKLAGDVPPIVYNVMNFNKGDPTLLSFDDARTLFHEFGHGLHGLLSDVTYPQIACTNVLTDWVELPSQLYEHWFEQPEVLRKFARHVETGEPMPEDLMQRLIAAHTFDRGADTLEYISSAMVDLDLHLVGESRRSRRQFVREADAGAHRHAGGDRHAAPHAAFHARVLRRLLRLGLLQLHVVGDARLRRLRGVRGSRQHLRSGDQRASSRSSCCPPAARAIRPNFTWRSAAGCRAPRRC